MPAPEGYVRAAEAGLIDRRVNIVHGNELTDRDLGVLVDHGATFNVTAEVEMQMCYGDLLSGRLLRRGVPFSIGTDIECAYGADMFAALRFTLQAQRYQTGKGMLDETGERPHPQPITARQALGWVTIEGARLARLERRTATLETGKAADLILVRANDLNMAGAFDPHLAVAGYANPGNIDTVMVEGQVRKRGGRMLRGDIPELQDRLARSGRRIFEDSRRARPRPNLPEFVRLTFRTILKCRTRAPGTAAGATCSTEADTSPSCSAWWVPDLECCPGSRSMVGGVVSRRCAGPALLPG